MRGGTLTYRELERDSDACAAGFAALGVRPGARGPSRIMVVQKAPELMKR